MDKEIGLDAVQKDLPAHLGDPTFIKIIVMLPQSFFWAAVKAVGNLFRDGARQDGEQIDRTEIVRL